MHLDRPPLIDWYRRNRARSRALFDLVDDEAYYTKPIALRHPIVFYEGHLPAFSFNTLVKKALGGASIDGRLETLFARGIDPHETAGPKETAADAAWPTREVVHQFAEEADHQVLRALANADVDRPGDLRRLARELARSPKARRLAPATWSFIRQRRRKTR